MPRADMEGAVADPIGAAYNTVRDSVDGVYDSMGGGEGRDVGALLWEVIRAAIAKDGDEVNELMHEFKHFGRAATDPTQLQEFYKDWRELLEEVRYSLMSRLGCRQKAILLGQSLRLTAGSPPRGLDQGALPFQQH